MERQDLLFHKYDFSAAVRNAPDQLSKTIDSLNDSQLFDRDQKEVIEEVVVNHLINVPVLDLEAAVTSQREVDRDVSGDPMRVMFGHGPVYAKATEVTFRVPYKGDRDVFYCQPSIYTLNPPRADVENDAIVIRVVREDQNAAEYRKTFDRTIEQIQEYLNQLRSDCANLDGTLRNAAVAHLAKRREKREKDRGLLDGLGFGKPKAK